MQNICLLFLQNVKSNLQLTDCILLLKPLRCLSDKISLTNQ